MKKRPLKLTAYRVVPKTDLTIKPAPWRRDWMDATNERFVYRCLPQVMANQAGWVIGCGGRMRAMWDGRTQQVRIEKKYGMDGLLKEPAARNHFGEGVLTFQIPWLFRTPKGWNLLVRGPPNHFKDAIQACEGLVETDSTEATFTMNWKFLRYDTWVEFRAGDPICFIVPQRRGELERFRPEMRPLGDDPTLMKGYDRWVSSRSRFNHDLHQVGTLANKQKWQRDYSLAAEQKKLDLKPFIESSAETAATEHVSDQGGQEGRQV